MMSSPRILTPKNNGAATPTPTPVVTDLNDSVAVATVSINETNEQKKYDIRLGYPNITGMADKAVEKKINSALDKYAEGESANFKIAEADTTVEPGMPDGKSTFDMDFNRVTPLKGSNILSFTISKVYFSVGAAHPAHVYESLNFDLKTGERITKLSTLLTGDYLNVVSKESIKLLKQKMEDYADNDTIARGAGPKEENFEVFFPTSEGLRIIFNEYQVAAYVAGPQEITIPYSALRSVINPGGPLKGI